jgi:hypothetical protein
VQADDAEMEDGASDDTRGWCDERLDCPVYEHTTTTVRELVSHPSSESWGYLILGSGRQLSGCRGIARSTLFNACSWYKLGMMVVTGSPCSARNLADEIPPP